MVWIDYQKHAIIDCFKIYKISDKVLKFIENTVENWRVELTAGGKSLAVLKIQRGIFQGDVLSLLLFAPFSIATTLKYRGGHY